MHKIVSITNISDTHGKHGELEDMDPTDILIHAGDVSNIGLKWDVENFMFWFNSLDQFKHKIFIAGNHDWIFYDDPQWVQETLLKYPNIIYLQDSHVTVEGLKVYGSPWQPEFCNWAFNLPRGPELKEKWDMIPNDTDILITHGPAYGYVDKVIGRQDPLGCIDLLSAIVGVKPKLHVCGHIHSGHGVTDTPETIFVNASVLDERYRTDYEPIKIYLEIDAD